MSEALVREFETQLAALAGRYAGRPSDELDALWLLGVEREAIVTVAYRRDVIEERLSKMPVEDDARALVARAIRWAWRDEQSHTLWTRGALLRRREPSLRARALGAQLGGLVGGWVSSRQNHFAWREAPLSRAVAELIEVIGALGGRIPDEVRETLHWNTFADFCRFNRGAETTAAMAWQRMAALASASGATEDSLGFARMAEDEQRHARLFGILADAFDERDRLTVDVETLRTALERVGQRFVARPAAGGSASRNPLGKGGTVVVREDADAERAARDVLDALGVAALLDARGSSAPVVALKTTFMLVAHRRDPSPGVSPRVLRAVVSWLRERGAVVKVIDAGNYYDVFQAGRSVAEVAAYLGLDHDGVSIVDAQAHQVLHPYARGMGVDTVAREWRDADVRMVLGKLRSHPTAGALLSLEAAEGLGARVDAHVFAERRAERETAVLMVLDALPAHVALLDAWESVPDGLMGVLGATRPIDPRRIYGSTDPVALDAVVCRHLGADPTHEASLVAHAFDWFGDPRPATRLDGPDTPIAEFRRPDRSVRTALLSAVGKPVFTHASLRGALFLPDFDEQAFPPRSPAPTALRFARAAVRRVVDDERDAPAAPLPMPLLSTTTLSTTRLGGVRMARMGKGPPVVLLHGYPETLQVWSRVAPRLAREREVIAFDWPGLGLSSPASGPADPSALADHLEAVLDDAGLARVDLVGADMGAPPALVFAARRPERVGTVVALSALLFGDEVTSPEIRVMRSAGLARAAFTLAPAIVYAQCKRSFLPAGEGLAPGLDADFGGAFRRPEVRARLAQMCEDYERALPALPSIYWKIRRPVRLLWAERSGHFPPAHAERMCALLPEARRVVLPGATHWMALSRPVEVATQIERFLAEAGS